MGRLAKLINFIRKPNGVSDVRGNPGGGATVDAYHVQPAGDDGHPLPTDTAMLVELPRSQNFASVGYHDPNNAQTAGPGERRIYARDADGNQVAEVFLHDDGQVRASNDNGFIDLAADGTIQARGPNGSATIAESGAITLDDGSGGSISISGGVITLTGTAINLVGPTDINGFKVSESGTATDANDIGLGTHSHTQGPDSAGNTQQRTDQASQP